MQHAGMRHAGVLGHFDERTLVVPARAEDVHRRLQHGLATLGRLRLWALHAFGGRLAAPVVSRCVHHRGFPSVRLVVAASASLRDAADEVPTSTYLHVSKRTSSVPCRRAVGPGMGERMPSSGRSLAGPGLREAGEETGELLTLGRREVGESALDRGAPVIEKR
jgi:hypothetical protein